MQNLKRQIHKAAPNELDQDEEDAIVDTAFDTQQPEPTEAENNADIIKRLALLARSSATPMQDLSTDGDNKPKTWFPKLPDTTAPTALLNKAGHLFVCVAKIEPSDSFPVLLPLMSAGITDTEAFFVAFHESSCRPVSIARAAICDEETYTSIDTDTCNNEDLWNLEKPFLSRPSASTLSISTYRIAPLPPQCFYALCETPTAPPFLHSALTVKSTWRQPEVTDFFLTWLRAASTRGKSRLFSKLQVEVDSDPATPIQIVKDFQDELEALYEGSVVKLLEGVLHRKCQGVRFVGTQSPSDPTNTTTTTQTVIQESTNNTALIAATPSPQPTATHQQTTIPNPMAPSVGTTTPQTQTNTQLTPFRANNTLAPTIQHPAPTPQHQFPAYRPPSFAQYAPNATHPNQQGGHPQTSMGFPPFNPNPKPTQQTNVFPPYNPNPNHLQPQTGFHPFNTNPNQPHQAASFPPYTAPSNHDRRSPHGGCTQLFPYCMLPPGPLQR